MFYLILKFFDTKMYKNDESWKSQLSLHKHNPQLSFMRQ